MRINEQLNVETAIVDQETLFSDGIQNHEAQEASFVVQTLSDYSSNK